MTDRGPREPEAEAWGDRGRPASLEPARRATTSDVDTDAPFVQLAGAGDTLYALDRDARVWKYVPAEGTRYAFWTRLTNHRATRRRRGD